MSARHFLIVVAIVQGGLLAALIVLIILNRWFRLRRSTRLNPRRQAVDASMRRWAAGTTPLAGVLVGLARLPVPLAIDALVGWSARVPGERWRQLAGALEHNLWARIVRTNSGSARWWKRLECARFLSVAAMPRDRARLLRLINDPHPAVHVAAVASFERMEDSSRARQLPASGVGRGAEAARDRSCLGGPRAGHALARHDHRRIHAAAAQSRSARRGVVGTPPSGARAHALLGRRPQRVARSRS